jgi:hypothetical protein
MTAILVGVLDVLVEHAAKMTLAQDDHMIKKLAPNR